MDRSSQQNRPLSVGSGRETPPWPRRILRLGIRQKVALILVATLFISLTVSGWLAFQSQRNDIMQETHLRGTELTHVIARALANPVVGYDYHSIELTLTEVLRNEDIVYAKVVSPRGNVMTELGATPANDEKMATFSEDIRLNGEPVGKLVLGLSLGRIAASLQQQRTAFIHREFMVIVLIVMAAFLAISFLVLRPITAISRVMSAVRRDDDSPGETPLAEIYQELPSAQHDEIGDLARTFVRLQESTSGAMEKLRRSEQKHRALIEAMPDMMFRLSRDGRFLDCKVPRKVRGAFPGTSPCGRHVSEVLPTGVATTLLDYLHGALATGQSREFRYMQETGNGARNYEARVTTSGEDEVLVIVRDVTEHREMEEQIHFLAHYDSLTHLPNRRLFKQRLQEAIVQTRRDEHVVAVMIMDLDHFKVINDTLGHDVGDLLLQGVAERLQRCLRASDYIARTGEENTAMVSRAGGDEFTILLTHLMDVGGAAQAARRVLETLNTPFRLHGTEINVNASLGISLYPNDGADVEALIKNADAALAHSKNEGRNNYRFYTEDMNAAFSRRLALEGYLRKALERAELELHYQPQVDIATGRTVGVEALLRWRQPELGMVSPAEFIPLAEDTGLILPISEWALRTACAQAAAWEKQDLPLRVAVNLSGMQFRQPGLVNTVVEALRAARLAPERLELELTEGILLRNSDEVMRTLAELKALGVHLSVDDFGTGYSSLSYLKRFAPHTLKIDRSFIRDVTSSRDDAAIVTAILAMARSLKFRVVAEGVETAEQLAFLSAHGCDLVQGFFFSPAVPAEKLPSLLGTAFTRRLVSGQN